MTHCDILIPGNYFCDLIFTGLPDFPALGTEMYAQNLTVVPGGCLNTVVALRRLGINVGWMGTLGTDIFSRYVGDWLANEGVSLDWVLRRDEPFQRVTVALSYPHERAFVSYIDPPPELISHATAAVRARECSHVHFTGLAIGEVVIALLDDARAAGITASMDCQHRPYTLDEPRVQEVLKRLTIFMPNAVEARTLTGETDLDRAAAALLRFVPMLVIKDGANGAIAWQNGEKISSIPMNVTPLDTTGAGDVFNAGFLAAIRAGHDLSTCMRWGNVCGGISTTGYGGVSTAPTLDQLQTHLK